MTEGRRLRGDGDENLQDYVEERLTYASDTDDLAAANRTLEQELADLKALQQERGRADARTNIDALIKEAELRVQRMEFRQGSELERGSGSQVDFDQLPPDAAARKSITNRMDENTR
ncbi:MAG TPA: hypothetical protein VFZ66_12105 [Herpetosiphonaceae bacterium]